MTLAELKSSRVAKLNFNMYMDIHLVLKVNANGICVLLLKKLEDRFGLEGYFPKKTAEILVELDFFPFSI